LPVGRHVLLLLLVAVVPPAMWAAPTVRNRDFTTSDGVKLHYLESGTGPTILFIPGWTMPAKIWQPQIDYFSKNYHVVAVDPRSQGDSDKPVEGNYPGRRAQDYMELIDHLGDRPVVLVAWSLAVYEALTFVDLFGTSKLNGLMLIDFNIYTPSTQEDRDARFAMFHDIQADRKHFAETFVRGMYRKPQSKQYLDSVVAASLKTPSNSAVALLAERGVKTDLRFVLPKLNIPVLALMTSANRSAVDLITAVVPGSQGQILEDAGHCMFVDDAERFNNLLGTFLEKTGKQGNSR
jgi:non-heme chloroperoxidase